MRGGRGGWVGRIYRGLMALYPKAFRRLYADEMTAAFVALHDAEGRRGGRPRVIKLWIATAIDLVSSGLRERFGRHGYRVNLQSDLRFPRAGPTSYLLDAAQDVRYAVRTLVRSPGFSSVVVLTLALGIGANTAIFSVFHGVLIEPLPFGGEGDVVHLFQADARTSPGMQVTLSVHEIHDYRERNTTLTDVAEYHRMSFSLTGQGEPDLVRVGVVSHNFFDLLEVRPVLGRNFVAAEDEVGASPVLLLSDAYWRGRFDSDPDVVGTRVIMNGRPHEIVGVLPPFPQFPQENAVYMPVSICPTRSGPDFMADRRGRMMSVYGRLRPGVSLEEARADVHGIAGALRAEHPDVYPPEHAYDADLALVHNELVAEARSPLVLLLGVAGFVLLIAVANAANLALSRSGTRRSEMAVRSAMGAGRTRIARQLLTENVLLALAGGGVGLLFAFGGLDLLVAYAERFTRRAYEVSIDGPVLVFTAVASIATGLLFGTAPALAERSAGAAALAEGSSTTPRRGRRLQNVLVVVQVSVAFTVLAGAGLMLRSVWEISRVDPGIDTERVVTLAAHVESSGDDFRAETDAFFGELLARFLEMPEIVAAARAVDPPLGPPHSHPRDLAVIGGAGSPVRAEERVVSPGYFEVVGAPIEQGRAFTSLDTGDRRAVALVNRTLAEALFSDENPIGHELSICWLDECGPDLEIVGVVGDVRQNGPEFEVPTEVYRVGAQTNWGGPFVLLRTSGSPEALIPSLSAVVHSVAQDVPVTDVRTLDGLLSDRMAQRRLTTGLVLLFASVAVGLSLAGVFGVLSLAAATRRREMGIRKALGARTGEVGGLVVREGMALVIAGLVGGIAMATALGSLMSGLLWGVGARDPVMLVIVAALFLAVATLACYLPARKASVSDVTATLRAN